MASQFGITLAVSVVLGFFAGQWLDEHLNTRPLFTLIGVLLGLVAAVLNTVRLYRALMRKTSAIREQPSADNGVSANSRRWQTQRMKSHTTTLIAPNPTPYKGELPA